MLAPVKQEPERDGGRMTAGMLPDEVRVKEELMTEASCAEEGRHELYADHVIKEELVLGPERPHRPAVGLTTRSRPSAADKHKAPQRPRGPSQPELKDCFVRLERLILPSSTRTSCSKSHETSASLSASKTVRPNLIDNRHVNQNKTVDINTIEQITKNASKLSSIKNSKKQKLTTNKPYICDTCGKVCKFRHNFIQHWRYHLPDTVENLQTTNLSAKPYSCDICKKGLSRLGSLKRHLKIHTSKKRHSCNVCGKKFLESGDLKRHILIHSGNRPGYPCDICKKILTTWSALKVHKRNVHLKLRLYSCDLCEKKYSTFDALKTHKRTHSDDMPFVCDVCDKTFRTIVRLRFHKRVHTTHKPYSCEHCNRGFRSSYSLKKHKLIHSDEKPFICISCKKMFATQIDLDEHTRAYKNPYKCGLCARLFCEWRYFRKHKYRTHGEKNVYSCEICRKDFKTADDLNQHKETHKGYSCGLCQQNFTDNIALQKHKRTHAGKMPYSCDMCGMKFKKWEELFTHGKTCQ